ncbi:protein FAM184A-like [Lineus longissimus]|uniref:protein FAM184A-like n=1 Tax=Lineus longissimus TaxID=88925 RepID=UPI002B4CB0F7
MASGTKSATFNYYNSGKYGTLPQNPPKDMEVTQDMHLKMSKKIAQLTKVIYALNTKNDEHEAIIQTIKEQNEERMQQLLSETRQKLAQYREKIGSEVEYKRRIEHLETSVIEYEKQRKQALTEFDFFRKQSEDRETELKSDHSQKVLSLSREVLALKRQFEDQLQKYDESCVQFELDKQNALEDLKQAHKIEIEELLKAQSSQASDVISQKQMLEKQYSQKFEKLKEDLERVQEEKKHLAEDYESKLSKAQAFYEKELAVLKERQNSTTDSQLRALQEENEKMRKDFSFQEMQFKKRIDDLLNQLSIAEEDVDKYKKDLKDLSDSLQSKDSNSAALARELAEVRQEASEAMMKLRQVEAELTASKQRCEDQAAEMIKKSALIGELEATRLQNEAMISDLSSELSRLKDKLAWLEKERRSLEMKSSSQTEEQFNQIRSLERALEDLSVEKQTQKEKYDRELKNLQERANQREKLLLQEHESRVNELLSTSGAETQKTKQSLEDELKRLKQELESKLESETARLTKERDDIRAEYEKTKTDLTSQLEAAKAEIKRLEALIKESRDGLGSASTKVSALNEASAKLQKELEATKSDLLSSQKSSKNLQGELDKLQGIHDTSLKDHKVELETRLDKLTKELEEKWTDTLRKECAKVRHDITIEKDEDKRATLAQLTSMKDNEMKASKEGWQVKMNELLEQITKLKQSMRNKEESTSSELDKLRDEMEAEARRLRDEMLVAADDYARKIKWMENNQKEELRRLQEKQEQELEDLRNDLKRKHMEELSAQMSAHRVTVESVQDQAEKKRLSGLSSLTEKHKKETEMLKTELTHKHSMEIEEYAKAHTSQMNAARMELDRAIELAKQKETQYDLQVQELQEDIRHRDRHIKNLEDEIAKLQAAIEDLAKEVDSKGKEILRVRSDANQQIRKREEHLAKAHKDELDNITADHLRETEEMLEEFNRAQEMLKDKISELQMGLDEAEERFSNRESRPDDLELIHQLRNAVAERELAMKKLLDDKKYYQMELVNRETNFNKVFNSTPNVGVLNPMVKKPKKGDKNNKWTSSPSLNSTAGAKLDPLPGSPLHDEVLNRSKPLPPPQLPHKKFVK